MDAQWENTDLIQMSVQTAELRFEPNKGTRLLYLSCGLMNIARGSCQLTVKAEETVQTSPSGELLINADRPVMTGTIEVSEKQFEQIVQALSTAPTRPVTLAMKLNQNLPVSLEGFLFIDDDQKTEIVSLQVNIPLR